jgi:hypothetical protein
MHSRSKSKMGAPIKYPLSRERVFLILDAEGDGYSAEKIQRDLPQLDDAGFPSLRMISNWKQAWLEMDADVRAVYRTYSWPDSHRNKSLPPEAAGIALQMQRICLEQSGLPSSASVADFARNWISGPTIRQVEYAYWLQIADPEMPVYIDPHEDGNLWCIWEVSRTLAAHDRADGVGVMWSRTGDEDGRVSYAEVVNDMLLWRPWESPNAERRYLTSRFRHRGPLGIGIYGETEAPTDALVELGWSPEHVDSQKEKGLGIFQSTGNEGERMMGRAKAQVDAEEASKKEQEGPMMQQFGGNHEKRPTMAEEIVENLRGKEVEEERDGNDKPS